MGFEAGSRHGLAILLWAAEPDSPHRLVTPFLQASAAAAMDMETELYFSSRSVLLLKPGIASGLKATPEAYRDVYEVMQEAYALGVRFYACSEALVAHGMHEKVLIPEYQGKGGVVHFAARASDPGWATLVF